MPLRSTSALSVRLSANDDCVGEVIYTSYLRERRFTREFLVLLLLLGSHRTHTDSPTASCLLAPPMCAYSAGGHSAGSVGQTEDRRSAGNGPSV